MEIRWFLWWFASLVPWEWYDPCSCMVYFHTLSILTPPNWLFWAASIQVQTLPLEGPMILRVYEFCWVFWYNYGNLIGIPIICNSQWILWDSIDLMIWGCFCFESFTTCLLFWYGCYDIFRVTGGILIHVYKSCIHMYIYIHIVLD